MKKLFFCLMYLNLLMSTEFKIANFAQNVNKIEIWDGPNKIAFGEGAAAPVLGNNLTSFWIEGITKFVIKVAGKEFVTSARAISDKDRIIESNNFAIDDRGKVIIYPQGSYLHSCKEIAVRDDVLTAFCIQHYKDDEGFDDTKDVYSYIKVSSCPTKKFKNINGKLMCE